MSFIQRPVGASEVLSRKATDQIYKIGGRKTSEQERSGMVWTRVGLEMEKVASCVRHLGSSDKT